MCCSVDYDKSIQRIRGLRGRKKYTPCTVINRVLRVRATLRNSFRVHLNAVGTRIFIISLYDVYRVIFR